MAYNTSNVAFGKPKVGGCVYYAPLGTAVPATIDAALDDAFVNLGYVSEDGIKNNNSPSSEELKAYGGDIVAVPQTEKPDEWTFTLIEALDENVLKFVYGTDNVSGTLAAGLTVRANSTQNAGFCMVIDQVLNGKAQRVVMKNARIKEIGERTFKDDELVTYEVTIAALPGDSTFNYDTHKEYYKNA